MGLTNTYMYGLLLQFILYFFLPKAFIFFVALLFAYLYVYWHFVCVYLFTHCVFFLFVFGNQLTVACLHWLATVCW